MKKNLATIVAIFLCSAMFAGCSLPSNDASDSLHQGDVLSSPIGHMELAYAEKFSVDYYEGGFSLVTIADDSFLLVPEGHETPDSIDIPCITQPISSIYVASSSAMDLFLHCDALNEVAMTSTAAADWSISEIRDAVSDGSITYVGKYHSPDYETILSKNCGLVVENTMIYHSPETKEMLESLGIPVLVEWSSYEPHPLGRVEWIKLYGLLTGHEDEAENFFNNSLKTLEAILGTDGSAAAFIPETNISGTTNLDATFQGIANDDKIAPVTTGAVQNTANVIDAEAVTDSMAITETTEAENLIDVMAITETAEKETAIDTTTITGMVEAETSIDSMAITEAADTENIPEAADRKTVSFFYITSSGYANVRRPGDYVSKMIALAGGDYLFPNSGHDSENSLTTLNMDLETFYTTSKDADILIYNSTVEADLASIDDLLKKSPLLADFKAVKTGDVWCTNKNMFQQISGTADMIAELYSVIHDDNDHELIYLHKLN